YEALHDRVDWWATLNEPWCSSLLSYAAGVHAPGMKDPRRAVRAVHPLLLAYGPAVAAQPASDAAPRLRIGLTPAPVAAAPGAYGPSVEHGLRAVDGWRNRVWLEALLAGRYPADVVDLAERFGGLPVQDGDLARIAAPLDWLGINYYQDLILGLADAD